MTQPYQSPIVAAPKRQTWPWIVGAAVLVAIVVTAVVTLLLAGRPAPTQPTGAAPAAASTTPAVDVGREACNNAAFAGNNFNFDVATNLAIARAALESSTPAVAEAAEAFAIDADAAYGLEGVERNLEIAQAQLDFLNECGRAYGADGPW